MVIPGNQSPQLKYHLGQMLRALDTLELSYKSWAEDASASGWIMLVFHCCSVDSVDLRMHFCKT